MKILFITPATPLRGGIALSSERLAHELLALRHEVVVYSFKLQYPKLLFPGKTQYTKDPATPGLEIKSELNSINPLNWILVGWAIARERPDRIFVRFWLPFMGPCLGTVLRMARLFSRKKKPRVTALVDNIVPHEKRPGDGPFARYFVRACDDFVVMSRSVGEEINQFLKPSQHSDQTPSGVGVVRYAPHPVYDTYGPPVLKDKARKKLKLPPDAPIVLFFGFIRAYKGLDLLLEALTGAPSIHALIAGECYESWKPYQAIIKKNDLEWRVHLHTDFVPTELVPAYFAAADLVVQPYHSATQSGISQIAYNFDKPMVVTNVGGLPEIVTHGVSGYVVEPEPGAIAAAIRDFFENDRAEAMKAGVRAEKARFSWGHLANVLLEG
ncbi:MAG: glycosyltransferase [Saprospiraceae bacterium]